MALVGVTTLGPHSFAPATKAPHLTVWLDQPWVEPGAVGWGRCWPPQGFSAQLVGMVSDLCE